MGAEPGGQPFYQRKGVEMDTARRSFLGGMVLALSVGEGLAVSGTGGLLSGVLAAQTPFPPAKEPEPLSKTEPRAVLKANQKDLKRDVERLAELAEELKKEVEKTDSTEILSLQLVRKAEEIEKLAKHIKSLARG